VTLLVGGEVKLPAGLDETVELVLGAFVLTVGLAVGIFDGELVVGRFEGWLVGRLDGWLVGRFEGWFVGWLDGWLVGRLEGWFVGGLEGGLEGWLLGGLLGGGVTGPEESQSVSDPKDVVSVPPNCPPETSTVPCLRTE